MNSPILHPLPGGVSQSAGSKSTMQGLALNQASNGWRTWSWGEKRYLVADKPGAIAIFDFKVTRSEVESPAEGEDEDAGEILQEEELLDLIGLEPRTTQNDHDIRRSRIKIRSEEQARPETGSASVLIAYQRSAQFGLGSVLCWVDNSRDSGVVIDGYWSEKERNMGMVSVVAEHLSAGPHRLSCELLERTADPGGGHEFRFIAVMHG